MPSPVRPGPLPGNPPPPTSYGSQPVTGNGRPQQKVKPQQGQGGTISSPGQVQPPPPVPQVGFRMPWRNMADPQAPQWQAALGAPAYNADTGEWWNG